MSYTHYTKDDCISLVVLLCADHTMADSTRQLHKDRSSLGREIELNKKKVCFRKPSQGFKDQEIKRLKIPKYKCQPCGRHPEAEP